jgi:pSer/pThr/pTyr-binding forkhead associated (FHA) protein
MRLVFVEEGPLAGRTVDAGERTIGREGCDVLLPDPEVSRRHARILVVDDVLAVEDLGSTNGTFVNGRMITGPTPLQPGDRVAFGKTVWLLQDAQAQTRVRARAR